MKAKEGIPKAEHLLVKKRFRLKVSCYRPGDQRVRWLRDKELNDKLGYSC
jgi:hypothetical protein